MTNGIKILAHNVLAQEVSGNGLVLGYVWPIRGGGPDRKWASVTLELAASAYPGFSYHPTKAAAVAALEGGGK